MLECWNARCLCLFVMVRRKVVLLTFLTEQSVYTIQYRRNIQIGLMCLWLCIIYATGILIDSGFTVLFGQRKKRVKTIVWSKEEHIQPREDMLWLPTPSQYDFQQRGNRCFFLAFERLSLWGGRALWELEAPGADRQQALWVPQAQQGVRHGRKPHGVSVNGIIQRYIVERSIEGASVIYSRSIPVAVKCSGGPWRHMVLAFDRSSACA